MPEPTATPAPTAPAPAPAPTPSPKPEGLDTHYAELDEIEKAPPPPKEKAGKPPATQKTSSQDTPADTASGVSDKEKPSSGSEGKDSTQPALESGSKPPEKPFKAAELRNAYEEKKRENASLKAEVERLRTAKPAEDPEKKTLLSRLEAQDKRMKELEEELSFTAYEKTPEYKARYVEPYQEAYKLGRSKAESLNVLDADGNVSRKGTPEDFDTIAGIRSDADAAAKAHEMFGTAASMVLYYRERVQELLSGSRRAIEERRKSSTEREQARVAHEAQQKQAAQEAQTSLAKAFDTLTSEAVEKYPDWFKPVEGDEKGNQLLADGFKFVDSAFKPDGTKTPQQMVAIHASIRNKAAAFGRMAYQIRTLKKENDQLKNQLSEFQESETAGGTAKRAAAQRVLSDDEEIEALDKRT